MPPTRIEERPGATHAALGAGPAALMLCSLLVSVATAPARADIVWEGRTVASWPEGAYDEQLRAPETGGQFASKFYPSPRGKVWGVTIIVDFSDQAPAFTKPQIEAWLNERNYSLGGLNGSVRDYFLDASHGLVDFQNDVVGFYRAAKPKSYYEGGTGYARSDELFSEVIKAVDPMVDFSKYDNDKDGRTDAVSIVYAGEGVTWGQGLWPHASGSSLRADGVVLTRYMISALSRRLALYTFCHEVGHMLFGWPDLYGFGDYCLMGNATNPLDPAGINDFFRADQGWIPEVEITPDTNARAIAPFNGGGFRYTNPADQGECFFWSNIQNQDRWQVLRGSGLLFFHYKRSIRSNNPPNPLALAVVQADGKDELGSVQWPSPGSDAKDFFFGGGAMELSDTTTPRARWRDGTSSGLRVYDIGSNGHEMQFSVGKLPPAGEVLRPDAGSSEDAGTPSSMSDANGSVMMGLPTDAGASPGGGVEQSPRDASADSSLDGGTLPVTVPLNDADGPPEAAAVSSEGCAVRPDTDARDVAGKLGLLSMLGIALASRRLAAHRRHTS